MDKRMTGGVSFMAFLMFMMLALWCANIFKHIRKGGWKGFIAAVDITGAVLLAGVFIALLLPLIK
ncbi:MAG: hypothetical protein K5979_00395 [Ruminococcus sp.]|nr:hypothetical protein [Ruminococcus sp.]